MKKYGTGLGTGWHLESQRHSLASKGIKTGRKIDYAMSAPERALLMNDTEKEINQILYLPSGDAVDKELVTIEIPRDKAHHLDFLKAFTSFQTKGKWKDISDDNLQIEIEFLDSSDEIYGERLIELFEKLNEDKIKEDVLYVRTEAIEESTLDLFGSS